MWSAIMILTAFCAVCAAKEVDLSKVWIPGISDNPSRLVTIHTYQEGRNLSNANCTLPDLPVLGVADKEKPMKLGATVDSTDCQKFTCLRVFETETFDVALISEYYGCYYQDKCYLVGIEFRDERCYRKMCTVARSKADGVIRSNANFVSVVADCPTAEGGCVPPGTKHFNCFLYGDFDSHCYCQRKGKITFTTSLIRFGEKVPTVDGNAKGSFCFFPFIYNGMRYNECTRAGGKKPWCGVTENFDRDKKWGFCSEAPAGRFTKEEMLCKLPFMYQGTVYHDCTKAGGKKEPWCSYQFKYDPKQTGVCDMSE